METEKDELIKKLTLEGKDKADVRRELISHGFSTEGFETLYSEYEKDIPADILKAREKSKEAPKILGDYESFTPRTPIGQIIQARRRSSLVQLFVLVVCCTVLYVLWSQYIDTKKVANLISNGESDSLGIELFEKDFNVVDRLQQGKVESTEISAQLYQRRMGTLDGVCSDIIVVSPIVCLEDVESYVIFSPISTEGYFCADSKGFRGFVATTPTSGISCK